MPRKITLLMGLMLGALSGALSGCNMTSCLMDPHCRETTKLTQGAANTQTQPLLQAAHGNPHGK